MPAPERVQELPLEPVNKLLGLSPFGLRGMAGNIWQWCRDTYDPDFYRSKQARCKTHSLVAHNMEVDRGCLSKRKAVVQKTSSLASMIVARRVCVWAELLVPH